MKSEYEFQSRWNIAFSRESLWGAVEFLLASDDPMAWWPSVRVVNYDGSSVEVRASSRFGYALSFCLSDLQTFRPDRLTLRSDGDLRGNAEVRFVDLGDSASAMDIDWHVATDRRWMRWSVWILRPVFVAGHHMVMRQGETHLNAWLAKRGRG